MDLPDARRLERAADMRQALQFSTLVLHAVVRLQPIAAGAAGFAAMDDFTTVMVVLGAVLDERFPVALEPALSETGIELLQHAWARSARSVPHRVRA